MFRAGEIVIAASPFTSLTDTKRRPRVVLAPGDTPNDFVVAFIATNMEAARLPSATPVTPSHLNWKQTGLKTASVIRADKLVTLNDSVISGAIGSLPADVMQSVRAKLKTLLKTS